MAIYLNLTLIILVLILISWIVYLELRVRKFLKGSNGQSLESVIISTVKSIRSLENKTAILENRADKQEEKIKNCIQKTAVLRFNPFNDTGSDQSFSAVFLNDEKDGMVISSLFGREINRIYAKPIKSGVSQYQLTNEEKEAIKQAN